MASITLDFESAHFLHSLFAEDLGLLKEAEKALGVTLTTRDAWLRAEGDPSGVEAAEALMADLEKARRKGAAITPQTFRYALAEEAGNLSDLQEIRLLDSAAGGGNGGNGGKGAITPRTRTQLEYLRALADHEVVFGVGPAGTGKTFLAMAHALDRLRKRSIDRIVLTRPAVEAGEALGFLPGALEEKMLPYLRPLYDAIGDMVDPREAQRLAEKNLIEIAPLAYMRGRTLNRSCVLLDEAQNTTREQMLMFLTRLGESSQCIVTGDPTQIDLHPRKKSGLLEAMDLLRGVEGVAFADFKGSDVVRHPVVARIIEAYDRGRGDG